LYDVGDSSQKETGMMSQRIIRCTLVVFCVAAAAGRAQAQEQQRPFEPTVGQPGKDVVWVPSPIETVERMLDVAKVTPQDFVVDLGSGDGRNIIAAAKRGARGLGIEFNPDMVELSRRNAVRDGVADRVQFVQGDMFEADFSKATVLALFLLPSNLQRLSSKFLNLAPGTRIVANTFGIAGWTPEQEESMGPNCQSWCTVLLYIVPAQVGGSWRLPQGTLAIEQTAHTFSGSVTAGGAPVQIQDGRVAADRVTFSAGGVTYTGRVSGDRIEGTMTSASGTSPWTATRSR
jgi:hypothetical protein